MVNKLHELHVHNLRPICTDALPCAAPGDIDQHVESACVTFRPPRPYMYITYWYPTILPDVDDRSLATVPSMDTWASSSHSCPRV